MSETSLDELAKKYGTDKSAERHNFMKHYERYLSHLREKPITMLEIGVLRGASLRVWERYFPMAKIIGADINPNVASAARGRVKIEIGDCGDQAFLEYLARTYGPFDLVIDDGSHFWRHQQLSFRFLFDFVKPGGLFIIEDIHTSYRKKYDGGLGGETTVEWLKTSLDFLVPVDSDFVRPANANEYHNESQWRRDVSEMVVFREACLFVKSDE